MNRDFIEKVVHRLNKYDGHGVGEFLGHEVEDPDEEGKFITEEEPGLTFFERVKAEVVELGVELLSFWFGETSQEEVEEEVAEG